MRQHTVKFGTKMEDNLVRDILNRTLLPHVQSAFSYSMIKSLAIDPGTKSELIGAELERIKHKFAKPTDLNRLFTVRDSKTPTMQELHSHIDQHNNGEEHIATQQETER